MHVKKDNLTYQSLSRLVALVLLLAFLVPSGLHAKALAEYCMADSNHASGMPADHSCCESNPADESDEHQPIGHHNCGWGYVCACNIGQSQLGDAEWIIPGCDFHIFISESATSVPLLSSTDELIRQEQLIRIGQHSPPLWLMYDTFLI